MRVPRMSPMFPAGPRRDETSSHPSIHEQTLRPDHEKEILYRRKWYEICLYVGTRISRDLPKRPGTQTLSPKFRHHGQLGGDYVRLSRPGPVFRNCQSANITAPRTVSSRVAQQIEWKIKVPPMSDLRRK